MNPATQLDAESIFQSLPKLKTKRKKALQRKHLPSPQIEQHFQIASPNVVKVNSTGTPEARKLFPRKPLPSDGADPHILVQHDNRIQNLKTSLWKVQSNIASLQIDQKRSEVLSIMALQKLAISNEVIHARLAALPTIQAPPKPTAPLGMAVPGSDTGRQTPTSGPSIHSNESEQASMETDDDAPGQQPECAFRASQN